MWKINFSLRLIMILIGTLFALSNINAQKIIGKVVDMNLTPISSATIILQTEDSVFVDAVISKDDGTFFFSQTSTPFILTIQHIAYKTIQNRYDSNNVGMIKMSLDDVNIDEIVVTAKRPYVKVENGKFVYQTKDLIQNGIVDRAWDLLNKLPGVSSNGSSVSLIGANKVSIIIDGKLTTLNMEQLYTILNSTPANRVEKAEIIYNAPPQYHVNGAVINLVMHQPERHSTEGEFAVNYANQYYNNGGLNANLRFAASKTTFDVMYGTNKKNTMQYSEMESHHLLYDKLYDISQTERISSKYWEHNIRTAFDYRINDKNSINFAYTAMISPEVNSQSHTIGDFQNSLNNKDKNSNLHNVSLKSYLGLGLSFGIDFTHYKSHDQQHLDIEYANGTIGNLVSKGAQTIDKYSIYIDQNLSTLNSATL